jgi:hypothetical protein
MTETEWLETHRIGDMLKFVCDRPSPPQQPWYDRLLQRPPPAPPPPRTTDRKLRLFACACCRWIWNRITEDWGRHAVEIAERHADGLATAEELNAAHEAARQAFERDLPVLQTGPGSYPQGAMEAACHCAHPDVRTCAERVSYLSAAATGMACEDVWDFLIAYNYQQGILRDLVGNPFRPAPAVEAEWLSGAVSKLAVSIYEAHSFDRLPLLADALEDAGCGDVELLSHFREKGPHVRGCQALDRVLGRD